MTLKCLRYLILGFSILLPVLTYGAPYYGASVSSILIAKDPPSLHGYQLMLNYDPQRLKWRKFNVYFDGGFSHFWTNSVNYSTINIYSIAPVVRYSFKKHGPILPYLELSIGLSYLNHTRIEDRNLGIHFAFQDRLGVGALLGTSERFSMGVNAVHYSNAHLANHNSGITAPLVLNLGYRFD